MNEIIFVVNESLDGGYEITAPGHSIFTQCETYEEIKETIKDAVECHFFEEKPAFAKLHFTRNEILAL